MRTAEAAGQPERVLIANTIIGPSFTRVPPPLENPVGLEWANIRAGLTLMGAVLLG